MSTLLLTDAKLYLNITEAGVDLETDLQAVIDAAEAAIAKRVGPLASTAITERVVPTGTNLMLTTLPAISVTSVTPYNGTALDTTLLVLNANAGVVTYELGTRFPATSYTVVYQAGRASVPADLLLAIKELVRHLWGTKRGSGKTRPRAQGDVTNPPPGAAYTFPIRVEQLLEPYESLGFA